MHTYQHHLFMHRRYLTLHLTQSNMIIKDMQSPQEIKFNASIK